MSSYSRGLNPDVILTELDDVFYQEHDAELQPQYATAATPAVFHQETMDSSAVQWEAFKGVGLWDAKQEEQDVPQDTPRIANKKTFTAVEFAKSVDIPRTFVRDAMHGAVEKKTRDMARKARLSRDQNAFAVFRNAFSTATTHDGVALVSDSHTAIGGGTVDNKVTGALSETTLFTAIKQLLELKDQAGVVDGSVARVLLVPPNLYKLAVEITESELRSATPDNDANVYSSKYGIMVYVSERLGAAVTGGSDNAWFVLGDNHSVFRFVREGLQTTLVDWRTQRNNNFVYKGMFSEVVGAMSWEALVGSNGS